MAAGGLLPDLAAICDEYLDTRIGEWMPARPLEEFLTKRKGARFRYPFAPVAGALAANNLMDGNMMDVDFASCRRYVFLRVTNGQPLPDQEVRPNFERGEEG